jgi:hypothetical protein
LTGISATYQVTVGHTPMGLARNFYPGEGGSYNTFTAGSTNSADGTLSSYNMTFEQHASVSPAEEFAFKTLDLKVVDVAQKLNVSFDGKSGNLSVAA